MRILITGGTGFFGRAFTRFSLSAGHTVCIFSRNEYNQYSMRQEFGDDPSLRWFIGDVRDTERLRRAMQGVHQVVHAAALKRIEVGHYNPDEMVKTNVGGTSNVIEAVIREHVGKAILLSSDKAFEPISAYGQSKAMAESLFLAANNIVGTSGPKFSVTRYGNVCGSTGSIIPIWRKIIADGKPVPVTDPNCTRFWMTEAQAVSLVSDTMDSMQGGELVIPDSLPAFRVGDLAEAMCAQMDVRGLGAHEKLHEGMRPGLTSDVARLMSVEEIREALTHVV